MSQRNTTSEALSHAAGSPPRVAGAWAPWSLANLVGRLVEVTGRARLTMACGVVLGAQQRHEPVAWVAANGSLFFPDDMAESGIDLDALPLVRVKGGAEAARAADLLLRSGAFGLVVLDLGTDPKIPIAMQSRWIGLAQKHRSALLCLTEHDGGKPKGAESESQSESASKRGRRARSGGESVVDSTVHSAVRATGDRPSRSGSAQPLSSLVSLRVDAWRRRDGRRGEEWAEDRPEDRADDSTEQAPLRADGPGPEVERRRVGRPVAQPEDRFACGVTATKDKSHGPGWHHEEKFRGPPGLC